MEELGGFGVKDTDEGVVLNSFGVRRERYSADKSDYGWVRSQGLG